MMGFEAQDPDEEGYIRSRQLTVFVDQQFLLAEDQDFLEGYDPDMNSEGIFAVQQIPTSYVCSCSHQLNLLETRTVENFRLPDLDRNSRCLAGAHPVVMGYCIRSFPSYFRLPHGGHLCHWVRCWKLAPTQW